MPTPEANGGLSQPIYSEVYPILHFDYRLVNETVRYIASNPLNEAVSPPVSFGFDALGMALYAKNNSQYLGLAKEFWNYYYSLYQGSNYQTAYARSLNTFALAGFKLYGCNSTVESFTRNFLGNSSGASIEEYGWGVAALYQLQRCTDSPSTKLLYYSFVNSFIIRHGNLGILKGGLLGVVPNSTFQYGEAASGLMLGGIQYNNPFVIEAMNEVFQSNVSGIVRNQPFHGDLANTETIPAYMLSTYLFQNEMSNATNGYYITGISNANITYVNYFNGTLFIGATGNNGNIIIESPNGSSTTLAVNGAETFALPQEITTTTNTVTSTTTETTTTTVTTTVTEYCSLGYLSACSATDWTIISLGVVFLGVGVFFILRRSHFISK